MFKRLLVCLVFTCVLAQRLKTGGRVCQVIEKLAANPQEMPGRTAEEVQEIATKAAVLMHTNKLDLEIDRLVADQGGEVQVISRLSGAVKKGPTTLIGNKKLIAKKLLSHVATKGIGKNLKTFIHKKLSQKLKGKGVDSEALKLVAEIAANEVTKVGISKLEAATNNKPNRRPRNRPGNQEELSDSGHRKPSSKKTLCIFSPPKEFCVVQMKDSRLKPQQELNPPDVGVDDDVTVEGDADNVANEGVDDDVTVEDVAGDGDNKGVDDDVTVEGVAGDGDNKGVDDDVTVEGVAGDGDNKGVDDDVTVEGVADDADDNADKNYYIG